MNHAYSSDAASQAYREFLASEDGRIFRSVLGKVFLSAIQENFNNNDITTLDAGCGDGWLAGLLCQRESLIASGVSKIPFDSVKVFACDAGEPLISEAKRKYPQVEFVVCDLNSALPYGDGFFDVVTASMVLHDVADEAATLKNLHKVLKPGGKLFASIVNPYYGYPIGEWKRGIVGRLLNKKPTLKLARFYNRLMENNRPNFEWRPSLGSHFTPLSHHMRAAKEAGFVLTNLTDISSNADSAIYNLTYQLHRFPIILLLEFTKI